MCHATTVQWDKYTCIYKQDTIVIGEIKTEEGRTRLKMYPYNQSKTCCQWPHSRHIQSWNLFMILCVGALSRHTTSILEQPSKLPSWVPVHQWTKYLSPILQTMKQIAWLTFTWTIIPPQASSFINYRSHVQLWLWLWLCLICENMKDRSVCVPPTSISSFYLRVSSKIHPKTFLRAGDRPCEETWAGTLLLLGSSRVLPSLPL